MGDRESVSRSAAAKADVPSYVSCIEIPGWSKPPFSFEGVTLRVFPLRADQHVLQRLVDRSLNIFPENARFRVFLPYVYVMLLDYGKMSIDAANLGWIAQHEVTFSIPLEWYSPGGDGKMRFTDWAYYSPFIFVDNAMSMTVGRQVYGWPKKLAYLNEAVTNWTRDPRLPANLAGISTGTYMQVYAGQRPDFRTFLEVEQRSIGTIVGWPPDPEAPWLPWKSIPTAIVSSIALAGDSVQVLRGLPWVPPDLRGLLRDPRGMAQRAAGALRSLNSEIGYNTINLKEFRDSESFDRACYQAITNARMTVTRFNGGGMLGDLRVLAGDPSGGMVLKLYDYPSLPVVKTMGLRTRSESSFDGTHVYTLEPVFPFWMDVNMFYNLGTTLVSYPPRRPKVVVPATTPATIRPAEVAPIVGAVGLSGQEVTGPFEFGNAIVRVLPLRADRDRLRRLCDRYLNQVFSGIQEGSLAFEPWGEHVYLVANSYGEMASKTNNVGWWAERELTFYMPVLVHGAPGPDGKRPLRTTALVPVLAYADSSTAAFSGSEVSGLPMMRAAIDSPPSSWMDQGGPATGKLRNLLRLKTIVLPVLGLGQPATERTLLEIMSGEVIPAAETDKRRIASQKWGPLLRDQVQSRYALDRAELKVGRVLAAELLSGALPFNVLTLKEFRDCEDPQLACYQSLVNLRYGLKDVLDLREIEEPLHVRIREYPSQPIVETLGLVPRSQDYEDGTVVYNIEAFRPFWMKVNLHVSLGQNLHWRTIKRGWTPGARPWRCFFDPDPDRGPLVGADLDDTLERRIPRNLTFAVREWKERNAEELASQTPEEKEAFLARAERAVVDLGPQAVLETVLSREWENRGRTLWAQELESIHDGLLRLGRAPGPLSQKLKDLDDLLAQIEKTLSRRTTHDRIRHELLGDGPGVTAGKPGAIQRLREGLQQLGSGRESGEPAQVPEEAAQAVESWFSLIQNPSEEVEGEEEAVEAAPVVEPEKLPALAMKVAFWLMRARQKPDFCVRREALLDLEVPPEEIYDGWYVGDELASGARPSPETPAIPSNRVREHLIGRAGG